MTGILLGFYIIPKIPSRRMPSDSRNRIVLVYVSTDSRVFCIYVCTL